MKHDEGWWNAESLSGVFIKMIEIDVDILYLNIYIYTLFITYDYDNFFSSLNHEIINHLSTILRLIKIHQGTILFISYPIINHTI